MHLAHALAAAAALLAAPAIARAQGVEGHDQAVDIEVFRPYADHYGYFSVPSSATLSHLQVGGSLWINYANDPVILVYEGQRTAPVGAIVAGDDGDGIVDDRLIGDVAVGIGLSKYFSLTFDVPLVLWQDGYDLNTIDSPIDEPTALISSGVSDLRIVPKLVALDLDNGPMGLAVLVPIHAPTGNGGSYLGEEAWTVVPTGVIEFSDGSVRDRLHTFRLALTGGYRVRDENDLRGTTMHNAFVYGVGMGIRPADPVEIVGEFHGELGGPEAAQQTGEVLFGLKGLVGSLVTLNAGAGFGVLPGVGSPDYRIFGGVSVAPSFDPCDLDRDKDGVVNCEDQCVLDAEDPDEFQDADGCPEWDNDYDGIEDDRDRCPLDPEDVDGYKDQDGCPDVDNDKDGILDVADRCPDEPESANGYMDEDGCPDDKPVEDTDGDGYRDDVDRCPYDAEDFDGFEDEDGCPELDNDGDSIPDTVDACPNDREIFNEVDDEDGCPDEAAAPQPTRVVIEKTQIRILDRIYFDFNKATIQPVSFSLLDEIAQVLVDHPELKRIRVEGHTDDVGSDVYNLKLSQSRAESVVASLASRGVEAWRLEGVGFGEMRPIDDNGTEDGRANNRRVEFIIVERD